MHGIWAGVGQSLTPAMLENVKTTRQGIELLEQQMGIVERELQRSGGRWTAVTVPSMYRKLEEMRRLLAEFEEQVEPVGKEIQRTGGGCIRTHRHHTHRHHTHRYGASVPPY